MQASDEQDGNKGPLKAEMENIFVKPKPKVVGSHRVVVSNKRNGDVADLHRTYCLSLSTAVFFYDLYAEENKTSLKLTKIAFLMFASLS